MISHQSLLLSTIILNDIPNLLGYIEIQIVTMSKEDRSKHGEVYVCRFVPSYVSTT